MVALLGSRMLRCLSSSVLVNKLAGSAAKCIEYLSPDSFCRNTIQVRFCCNIKHMGLLPTKYSINIKHASF